MKYRWIVLSLITMPLAAITIAITIDDFPMADGIFTLHERTERMLKACADFDCKVAFFCVGAAIKKCDCSDLLTQMSDAGHFLANHSMSHTGFSKLSITAFEKELLETENLLRPYSGMRKWFRFPGLDYGNRIPSGGSEEKYEHGKEILSKHGYIDGYVSINTFDWHLNSKLLNAYKTGAIINYAALKKVYLSLLNEWIRFYIDFYKKNISSDRTHTLLLHANDLNALFLSDIFALIKINGWHIASPEQAFEDTSWRSEFLSVKRYLLAEDPPSLTIKAIDATLQNAQAFKPVVAEAHATLHDNRCKAQHSPQSN